MASQNPLGPAAERIIRRFEGVSAVRDRAIAEARQLARVAANSIRAAHRQDMPGAEQLLGDARNRLAGLSRDLENFPNLYWAGYVQDAAKEVAEAAVTLAALSGHPLPTPEELGIEDAAYLNGLAEAGSELRRDALDRLREGDTAAAERHLQLMDDLYGVLVTIDFPDAITGGLRRTTDAFRAVLERTRGDVTMAVTQDRVERALRRARVDRAGDESESG